MSDSILDGKRILAVDDEADILRVLEDEILYACPSCTFEKATDYDSASLLIETRTYDVIILDIMGVRGFDLLEKAVHRGFKVAMLTAHALTPEALERSIKLQARAYLPKDRLGEVVPFLEDILTLDYVSCWKRLFKKLDTLFDEEFEAGWREKASPNWKLWLP